VILYKEFKMNELTKEIRECKGVSNKGLVGTIWNFVKKELIERVKAEKDD